MLPFILKELEIIYLAEQILVIIYFSFFFFFDTGAIELKEIRNYGVIAFSLQKEIIDNETIIIISSESWKEIYLPEA